MLVDRNENGGHGGTRVKEYKDGTKMFRVDWGCLNYIEVADLEGLDRPWRPDLSSAPVSEAED